MPTATSPVNRRYREPMLRALKLLGVAVIATAATGCGNSADDDTTAATEPTGSPSVVRTSSAPSPAPLPTCAAVWRAGRTLPLEYLGCRDAGVAVTKYLQCESGQQLFTYRGRLFAIPGGRVFTASGPLADDMQFQRMHRACTA